MVLIKSLLILTTSLLSLLIGDGSQNISKRVDKTLSSIWPEQELSHSPVSHELLEDSEQAYAVYTNDRLLGYYLVDQAKSKFDSFDYMVVFDPQGQILQPSVLVYREDYGGEICSKRWLRQFIGLSAESDMRLGQEVQNISGATISCNSASHGFKSAAQRIKAIIDAGH